MMNSQPQGVDDAESEATDADSVAGVEETLLDIRKLIAEIENPFTLVGKLVDLVGRDKAIDAINDQAEADPEKALRPQQVLAEMLPPGSLPRRPPLAPPSSPQSTPSSAASPSPSSKPQSGTQPQAQTQAPAGEERGGALLGSDLSPMRGAVDLLDNFDPRGFSATGVNADLIRHLNSLELASFLADLFGKERSIEILGSYVNRNWIKEETAKIVLDANTLLQKEHFKLTREDERPVTAEDHRVALYLLEEFDRSMFSYPLSLRFQELLFIMRAAFNLSLSEGQVGSLQGER